MSEKFHVFLDSRVKKTLNSSYKSNPLYLNLPTFSEMRKQDYGARFNYFALYKSEKGQLLSMIYFYAE